MEELETVKGPLSSSTAADIGTLELQKDIKVTDGNTRVKMDGLDDVL
jgi:hypothetical protein